MKRRILWITRTAALLALLVVLQWLTKPWGQLVTGSCVNGVLAIAALFGGVSCGLTVALVSPVCAYLFGIAPQILTVPVIMLGNSAFVTALGLLGGMKKPLWQNAIGWIVGAAGKFVILCVLVKYGICGILADGLMAQGLLKAPMLTALPATFGATQLVTALIGGGLAMVMLPVLKKAIKRS